MALEGIVKPHIAGLEPYQPGKPIEELARELGIEDIVKLASNESPLGPSRRALAAIREAAPGVHRYPDGASHALRQRLARGLAVEPQQIVFGAGADELLELLAKCFLGPGDEAVFAWPSFAMYPIVVQGMGARPVSVPLDSALVHDLPAMARAVGPRTRLVFLCNPNNPTGTSVGAAACERFARELPPGVVLAVDEAYADFARRPDFPRSLELVRQRPGTVVLRTFSKLYGLAGLRVGYGVADLELAGYLERARHPFNVNRLAEVAALAALDDDEHVERALRVNAEGIEYLARELAALGIEVWPTDANFVLARPGPSTYERLLREGVIVRPLGGFGMPEHVRITVGLPEENERLVKALRRIRESGERRLMGAPAGFERVAVLGLGLLGGSLAGALRRRGIAGRVAGATRSREARASALRRGLVDEVGSPREAVAGADLVVLATPVFAMPPLLREVAGSLREGTLVTDVGSVKGLLADTLPGLLPEGARYVGSHPMAGSHERGLEHARDDLFEGAACIVSEGGDPAAVERVCGLWRALGARVVRRPAHVHDAEVAWMSHVPHVLAFAFAGALAGAPEGAAEVAGAGFRDFTRIAQSNPELWGDILTANRKACAPPLQAVAAALAELTRAIESNDAEAVERWIAAARETLRRQAPSGAARASIPVGPEGRPERRTNDCA